MQHIVEDAVNSQNFSQLNKAITNTVNETVGSIRQGLRTAEEKVNKEWNRKSYRWYSTDNKQEKRGQCKKPETSAACVRKAKVSASHYFRRNAGVKAGGLTLTILRLHSQCRSWHGSNDSVFRVAVSGEFSCGNPHCVVYTFAAFSGKRYYDGGWQPYVVILEKIPHVYGSVGREDLLQY